MEADESACWTVTYTDRHAPH